MKKIIPILLLTVLFLSCKKSNVSDYPEFKGFWVGLKDNSRHEINVKNNGKATYEIIKSNSEVWHKGNLIIKNEELKIGFKKVKINQYPSNNVMILDNIDFYKN